MFLKKLFNKDNHKGISMDEIAELLKVNPAALEDFESMYESTTLNKIDDNFFNVNAKQASMRGKADREGIEYNKEKTDKLVDKIVHELLTTADNNGLMKGEELVEFVTREDLASVPKEVRPQLTGNLMLRDIPENSYIAILEHYKAWQETGDELRYHMFRQGLDILDLDPITYEIIGTNPNSMGNWLPQITESAEKHEFFKIPETKVIKVPLPILQLTRADYMELTQSTLDIVNKYCMEAFDLDVDKKYFIKTGTYSSKFDFRNALVQGESEVRTLGEYLLYIHFQALQMASPLSTPTIYGVSTTNEWVVREFIEDVEDNPTIYKGMPLHTEYRVFVDFDTNEVMGVSPYWREDVMKESFLDNRDNNHNKHDYVIYTMHEDILYERYNENVKVVLDEVKKLLPDTGLEGQWSIDVMQNGDDFYIIDMALALQSALNDCIDPNLLSKIKENWIPRLN